MENWDVLDKDGNLIGKTVKREKVYLLKGEYHLVVHIWVVGPDGRLIIQRRSDQKQFMPGEWAAHGGAAISGETSVQAAKRELFEEIGVEADASRFKLIRRIKKRNSLVDVYLVRCNVPMCKLVLQQSEVAEVKKVHLNQLKKMVNSGEFHNYGKAYFDSLFSALSHRKNRLRNCR
ncbi:MAG: NUDIX domain-containing protein [bacterium]|nr:NUDIX domain-containing protein [bacterium]